MRPQLKRDPLGRSAATKSGGTPLTPKSRSHRSRALGLVGLLLLLASRPALSQADPGTVIHPEPGSTSDSLFFHAFVYPDSSVSNGDLRSITVTECQTGRRVWRIERKRRGQRPPLLIRYGSLPSVDWTELKSPERLRPGCYSVSSTGGGIGFYAEFEIRTDGSVIRKAR